MTTPYSQESQELAIVEPTKSLLLAAIEGEENLSEPFVYRLTLYSEKKAISPADLLGKPVTVLIRDMGQERPIHGRVRRFVQGHRFADLTEYRMEIVPWLWLLSLSSDCRHWQEKHVLDITEDVLKRLGFSDYKIACAKTYPEREFCVQYNETHLDFLSRLWEEEGIYYAFVHEKDRHTLYLADDPSSIQSARYVKKLQTGKGGETGFASEDVAVDVRVEHQVHPQAYVVQDFDFEQCEAPLKATATSSAVAANGERFEYPGPWMLPTFGDRMVKARLEHDEALHTVVFGTTDSVLMQPGTAVDLHDPPTDKSKLTLHIIGTRLTLRMASYGAGESQQEWLLDFTGIPRDTPFRPPRKTAKPRVYGAQTAMVVTESQEEITTDQYSRVKVKFHWDRTEAKSCWVRLSSAWAGGGLGFVQLPRERDEVIVDFLDGDPDRPIITGRVYNATTMPPLDLPGDKAKSGLKSRSLDSGSAYNELWFDDTNGEEKVSLYAGKDYEIVVKNDCKRTVQEGNDDIVVDKGDQSIAITEGSQTIVVHKDRNVTIESGNDGLSISQGDLAIELSAGNVTIKAAAGKISLEALQGIELKVGQTSVKLDQTGLELAGTMVKMEGTAMTQVKGAMTQVNADGMLTLKGSMTMVN